MPIRPVAYKGSEPYIFVSYAHKDSEIILPLIQGLQDQGFRVWYDAGIEVGTEWPDYIAEHLNGSACVIAFISRNSVDSHNCRREINFAIELRKDPLVVYMEDLELPLGMRMQLGSLHAMFYYRHGDSRSFLDTLAEAAVLQPCRAKTAPAQKESTVFSKQEPKPVKAGAREAQIVHTLNNGRKAEDRGDYAEAAALYRFAAELGDAEGQYSLARCYDRPSWAQRDPVEAVKWLTKAAQQGHVYAQTGLGDRYLYGNGVKKDAVEAAKWYRKAANQGNGYGQLLLAKCYEQGLGVSRNLEQALKYYEKAAAQGYVVAKEGVERCKKKLKNPLNRIFG